MHANDANVISRVLEHTYTLMYVNNVQQVCVNATSVCVCLCVCKSRACSNVCHSCEENECRACSSEHTCMHPQMFMYIPVLHVHLIQVHIVCALVNVNTHT